ncbi:MAG: OB-fold nucleic acid binding domain-containing protein, partial [Thermodesulfobacteriota bacterium]
MRRDRIRTLLARKEAGGMVSFGGWVRTVRQGKGVGFVEVNDGSCFSSLQVVVEPESPSFALLDGIATGASIWVTGTIVDSPGKGQKYEVRAESLEVVGPAPEDYPLQKKRHSFEYLREIAHLRPRTNTFGAVLRIRNILARTVHDFFQSRGFLYVQTPIITTSDCEGAGEMFGITVRSEPEPADQGAEREPGEFFGKPAGLTVSGQLEAEAVCSALGDVYTFGPTFRAENS